MGRRSLHAAHRELDGAVRNGVERIRRRGSRARLRQHSQLRRALRRRSSATCREGEGFGYRARLSDNGPRTAGVEYQGRYGSYAAEVSQLNGDTAERVFASGGIGLIAGHPFASRTINDSFGLVRVPGYAGVRVFAQNQEVGRTDDKGELVVPRLLPYLSNPLRIEQADLPIDVEIDTLSRDAVPYFRSGVVVEFPVRAARSALVTIVQEDGAPVPAGARGHRGRAGRRHSRSRSTARRTSPGSSAPIA